MLDQMLRLSLTCLDRLKVRDELATWAQFCYAKRRVQLFKSLLGSFHVFFFPKIPFSNSIPNVNSTWKTLRRRESNPGLMGESHVS